MPDSSAARRWTTPLLLSAILLFFLIANRGAYKGYFDSDDLNNLNMTRQIPGIEFVTGLFSPRIFENNFRPAGHLFYRAMGQLAGLNFVPYIAVIHVVHLANVILIWLLLRKLGFETLAAFAGALFFAFQIAVFDAYWKPMYVFDLICACFCLLSSLAYLNGRLILSLAAFVIAFRAKEVAIMFPVVLAAYEFGLGGKRWKRLIPFFAISLALGIQALRVNLSRNTDYTLRFSLPAIWSCIAFYSSKLFLIPYAGFAVVVLPFLVRDRRVRVGVVAFCALLVPMLLLPGRQFAVYLYVPLIGLSITAAALASARSMLWVAAFFLVWIPWNYVHLRWDRRTELAGADARRIYVTGLANAASQYPSANAFVFIGAPLSDYAVRDTIQLLRRSTEPVVRAEEDPAARSALNSNFLLVLEWDSALRKFHVLARTPDTADAGYITMDANTPIWQLRDGWLARTGAFRWTKPSATALLRRPANANQFELVLNVNQLYIDTLHRSRVQVRLNGTPLEDREIIHSGWQTLRWNLPPAPASSVEVRLDASPPYPAAVPLGLAIVAFGFK